MESTDLHHLQDQPPAVETSLSTPSCYGIGSGYSWTPEVTSNNAGNFNQFLQEDASRSRDSTQNNDIRVPPLNGSMIQDLGYNWTSDAESCLTSTQPTHEWDLQFSKIKEEISNTFPKFTEMLNSASSREDYGALPSTTHLKNEQKDLNALSEKLLLKTLSSGDFYSSSSAQNFPSFGGMGVPSRGNFSQIYPSINVSNLNQSSPAFSTSLNMNMQSLYLLTSARFSGDSTQDDLGGFTESLSLHLDHMQHPIERHSCNSSYPSHFPYGMVETKRPGALMESKASQSQTTSKKSRLESCPPFKVRKEKLGDRIAALQQLVAPFGKTDTASVLLEATGYIKFLQNQVQTLSVPYLKPSGKHNKGVTHGGYDRGEEPNPNLRSRGLCLVPLSCMSYITADAGEVWQRPSFGAPTNY